MGHVCLNPKYDRLRAVNTADDPGVSSSRRRGAGRDVERDKMLLARVGGAESWVMDEVDERRLAFRRLRRVGSVSA